VLRKIFGPTREEVTGDWRQLHNEELHDVYCSTNMMKIKEDVMGRACAGEKRNVHTVVVQKPEGKRLVGSHKQ